MKIAIRTKGAAGPMFNLRVRLIDIGETLSNPWELPCAY